MSSNSRRNQLASSNGCKQLQTARMRECENARMNRGSIVMLLLSSTEAAIDPKARGCFLWLSRQSC